MEESFDELSARWEKERNERHLKTKADAAATLQKLKSAGYTRLQLEYDGCGDEGSFNVIRAANLLNDDWTELRDTEYEPKTNKGNK